MLEMNLLSGALELEVVHFKSLSEAMGTYTIGFITNIFLNLG